MVRDGVLNWRLLLLLTTDLWVEELCLQDCELSVIGREIVILGALRSVEELLRPSV
jgi:hypothetical protein